MNLEIGKTYTYSYECCKTNNIDYKRFYYKITGLSKSSFNYDHYDSHANNWTGDLELRSDFMDVGLIFEMCAQPQHIITKRSAIA